MSLKLNRRHGSSIYYIRGTIGGIAVERSTRTSRRVLALQMMRVLETQMIEERYLFGKRQTYADANVAYQAFRGGDLRFFDSIAVELGDMFVHEIAQEHIDAVARKLYPNGANSTLNRQVYTPISAVLKHASASGYCERVSIRRPKQPKGRLESLSVNEAEGLLAASSPHLRPLILFMLLTGARSSEAMNLDWRDVDLSNAQVTFQLTKNGERRSVPLHPSLVAALAALSTKTGKVFRTPRGKAYTPRKNGGGGFRKAFASTAGKAGVPWCTPHHLRHTWATWHYQRNRNLIELQILGGWKSTQMVMRYAHANVDNFAQGISNLPDLVGRGNCGNRAVGVGKSREMAMA